MPNGTRSSERAEFPHDGDTSAEIQKQQDNRRRQKDAPKTFLADTKTNSDERQKPKPIEPRQAGGQPAPGKVIQQPTNAAGGEREQV